MKFYDTCSLLLLADELIEEKEQFVISSITLNELERIKISNNKDPDIKFTAHKILTFLDNYPNNYIVKIFTEKMIKPAAQHGLVISDDIKILMSAYDLYKQYSNLIFISNDLSLRKIAELFFPIENIDFVKEDKTMQYSGYKEIIMDDIEMSKFYSNLNQNLYNLHVNEYLIIRNQDNEIVDTARWDGNEFKPLKYGCFNSKWFGDIKPFKNDIYQAMVCDSFQNNVLTMVRGAAGTGKSWLSIGYLIHLLEKGKIDKIIIFCNTVAAKNAAKLGFYPGSRTEKLLDSQIGNFLTSKFGSRLEVERMIEHEQLILLPLADIRGFDTSGMNAGIYITEAQNLDIELMKLALQRIGADSICIIDGDDKTQVDDIHFAGSTNGMKRVSKVFRGKEFYGEVELKIIHRSKIAKIADNL